MSHHPLGGAADFAGLRVGESASGHDDQVGVQFFGGFGDLIERATALDRNFTSQRAADMPATQDMQALPRVTYETLVGPLPTHRSVAEVVGVEYRLNNVNQRDGRGVATGLLHRRLKGAG